MGSGRDLQAAHGLAKVVCNQPIGTLASPLFWDNPSMSKRTIGSSKCAVTGGEVDLASYARRDSVWREVGLAAPARRALVDAKIVTLAGLAKRTRASIAELHGMGPSALRSLDAELRRRGLAFHR